MSVIKPRVIRHVAHLNRITTGLGTLRLPLDTTMLDLQFYEGQNITESSDEKRHQGPRKFWEEILPKIQFYNPGIAISVRRLPKSEAEESGKKSVLKMGLDDGSFRSIEVEGKTPEEIVEEMIKRFKAKEVPKEEIKEIILPETSLV